VRCLSALPLRTFYAPPNWIEFLLLTLLATLLRGAPAWAWLAQLAAGVIALEVALAAATALPHAPPALPARARAAVALAAA
jgi:hypothetical protein